jgi:phosphoenolpyruvate carboxykinase (GTP)
LKKEEEKAMTSNKSVISWLDEVSSLCRPKNIVWVDGTKEQTKKLYEASFETGETIPLNQDLLPGCVLHRSDVRDVARVEDKTFICSRKKGDAGPTNNWWNPKDAYPKLRSLYDGCMQGRTMYVIPFVMGPFDSPFSKIGIEVTDSLYVVLSMLIVTRAGERALAQLGDSGDWVRCLHSNAQLDPDNRFICHFPEDNAIWSINSGYGGNALLGKKCFSLRIASNIARHEGWMAEHMLILGIEDPHGNVRHIAAAFPSACGKTNLAMLIPPDIYRDAGYKVWCVGDDIAWMRIGDDGRLYAINAENGFFGVAPGTNEKTNFNALETTRKNTIFTNVCQNLENNTVWWEGLDKNPPSNALDWRGDAWNPSLRTPAAHPNSRFTAPAENCPVISSQLNDPAGVPIDAILFGGRRAKTAPLVYEAFDWEHGVFVGSAMASETTAAAAGKVGVVRRDPMAMLPFCGYNMADYFVHWLEMGKRLGDKAPKIFNVNWFRLDDEGNFIWPGFGENMRVLMWILDRAQGKADALATPIGYLPSAQDLDLTGLDISEDAVADLLNVDGSLWRDDANSIEEFYQTFGERLPNELKEQLSKLKQRLNNK